MKKVVVVGAKGMVGSRFVELASEHLQITPLDKDTIDITDREGVEVYFKKNSGNFEVVVNLAAFTDVLAADREAGEKDGPCWALNVLAPEYLAEASRKYDKFLIHFSTDFVFEGLEDNKGPFDEDASLPETPNELSWYGWTKLLGEKAVNAQTPEAAIVRIANPYRAHYDVKTDLARKILTLFDEGNLFPLFTDQIITPLFVDDLVGPLSKLIEAQKPGNYHFVSSDSTSYYGFGEYLIEKARGIKNAPEKSTLVEFLKTPGRNKRPLWGGLKVKKTEKKLGVKFRTWRRMVDDFVGQISTPQDN